MKVLCAPARSTLSSDADGLVAFLNAAFDLHMAGHTVCVHLDRDDYERLLHLSRGTCGDGTALVRDPYLMWRGVPVVRRLVSAIQREHP